MFRPVIYAEVRHTGALMLPVDEDVQGVMETYNPTPRGYDTKDGPMWLTDTVEGWRMVEEESFDPKYRLFYPVLDVERKLDVKVDTEGVAGPVAKAAAAVAEGLPRDWERDGYTIGEWKPDYYRVVGSGDGVDTPWRTGPVKNVGPYTLIREVSDKGPYFYVDVPPSAHVYPQVLRGDTDNPVVLTSTEPVVGMDAARLSDYSRQVLTATRAAAEFQHTIETMLEFSKKNG